MPQTITGGIANTITLPATDVATVNYDGRGRISVMNYGPGKVMVSDNPNIVPSMASTNCLLLGPGVGFTGGPIGGKAAILLIADTASTIVSVGLVTT